MTDSPEPSRAQTYWEYDDDAYSIYSHTPALYAEQSAYHLDHWVGVNGWSLALPRTPANDAQVQAIVEALTRLGTSAEDSGTEPAS